MREDEHYTYIVDKFTWVVPDKDETRIWLNVTYSLVIEGSVCKKVQIGKVHKEYDDPVFEIVCKEGAEEEALIAPKLDPF
jgi:hypothetical protein